MRKKLTDKQLRYLYAVKQSSAESDTNMEDLMIDSIIRHFEIGYQDKYQKALEYSQYKDTTERVQLEAKLELIQEVIKYLDNKWR